jgi:hypothetical protein
MKITNQTADELELKEGSASGIVVGVAFIAAGVVVEVVARNSFAYALWVMLGLIVLGIGLILFASSITLNASRASGQIQYQKKRMIGTQNSSFAIGDVFRIETRKQWQMQNSSPASDNRPPIQQPVLVAQSVIVFRDGRELALDHQKTSSTTQIGGAVLIGGQANETAMAAQVAKWLGVPFEEVMPPNMGGGINIIST